MKYILLTHEEGSLQQLIPKCWAKIWYSTLHKEDMLFMTFSYNHTKFKQNIWKKMIVIFMFYMVS